MKQERRNYKAHFETRKRYDVKIVVVFIAILIFLGLVFRNYLNADRSKIDSFETTNKTVIITADDVDFSNLTAGAVLEVDEITAETLKNAKKIDVAVEVTETRVISERHLTGPVELEEMIQEATEKAYVLFYTENDVVALAKLLTGEARGVKSLTRKSGVLWIVLNRVMSGKYPNTIIEVITQPNQFDGWDPNTVPTDECLWLAQDVLERWNREMNGEINVGRTIPTDYLFFTGDGVENYFTTTQFGDPYVWGSQLISPYKN